jgi:hypothetical protein
MPPMRSRFFTTRATSVVTGVSRADSLMTASTLDGGPSSYLQSPLQHGHGAHFREMASFQPFEGSAGTRVATTSTTTGANLLVSGVAAGGTDASVLKYQFVRPDAQSRTVEAVRLGQVWSGKGSQPAILGGD